MIKKVEVLVAFPQGAVFQQDMNRELYIRFLHYVKYLSCFVMNTKCNECDGKSVCRYSIMTGNNFQGYPAVLGSIPLFEKRRYQCNEEKKIIFYFIGNQGELSDFVSLFFEALNQTINGYPFYLKQIKTVDMKEEEVEQREIFVKTPMEQKSFIEAYNHMVQYYNSEYKTNLTILEPIDENVTNEKEVSLPEFRVKTCRKKIKGLIGTYHFAQSLKIDGRFKEIGIGKYNFIGGGQIEAENSTRE